MSTANENIQALLLNDCCSCPKGQPCPRCVLAINDAKQFLNQPEPLAADPVREALVEIRAVACGETQIESTHDDTETLGWIFRRAEAALRLAERKG